MLKMPARRRRTSGVQKPNLIPILDAVFIFIFFLLMSASFVKLHEIPSSVPIVSDQEVKKQKKKPLALTVNIYRNKLDIIVGLPARKVATIRRKGGSFDLERLKKIAINLKKTNLEENTAILGPRANVEYLEIIKIMDALRVLRPTDEAIYIKKQGMDIKLKTLFNNIMFDNIRS